VGKLDTELWLSLPEELELEVGERFDEAAYAADEERMRELLRDESYARADVRTEVVVDRVQRGARVRYFVTPGPRCTFGKATVEGNGELSAAAVLDVARLKEGEPYSESEIRDAERAVYALGVFSSVKVEPRFDTNPEDSTADLVIRVQPGRLERFRVGIGVMSGSLQRGTSDELMSVPIWDFHLRIAYEHDSFLGDMRKLRIEDRPRIIMLRPFPEMPDQPALGNTVTLTFEQPRFPEHRTVSFTTSQWDFGPDAYLGFFRHDVATRVGARRSFFGGGLFVELALQHDLYEITDASPPDTVSSYRLPFAEQQVRIDLRNDAARPSRGAYFSNTLQEAVQLDYGSWDYLRWLTEVRAYQRLLWKIVLAERIGFGGLFIQDAARGLDPTSAELGPQAYRLRGGGANSNRGFGAGELGAGIDGGKRRWEATLELRVPLGADFGMAFFLDAGDVNAGSAVRLNHVNTSTGFGLRYYTPFAPIRFDAGWRIPGWQRVSGVEPETKVRVWPSAAHLTIGEAF
jgi:outer membrane translocation and assembly module TamA